MLTRIITGVVGIALAAFVIQTGGTLFAAFALVLSLLAWFEYVRAFAHLGHRLTFVLGLVFLVLLWGCAWLGSAEETMAVTTAGVLLLLLVSVLLHGRVTFQARACFIPACRSRTWCCCARRTARCSPRPSGRSSSAVP